MDEIIALVNEISIVVGVIEEKQQHAQRCRAQCKILAETIKDIHGPLKNFYAVIKDRVNRTEALKKVLDKFLTIIRDAQDIIKKHCNVTFYEKVFLRNKFEDDFINMNLRLTNVKNGFSAVMDASTDEQVAEITSDMNNVNITTRETAEELKAATKKANEGVKIAIEEVQKAKESEVREIPTMGDSEITLHEEPGPMGRALGTLKRFQPIELIYNKGIIEDKRKLGIMWRLSSCEGILTLHGLYKHKDKLYMITERPNQDYPTLDLMIKNKPFLRNWGVIRSMLLELANAIGFMHECQILHKAICTGNICIVGDRHVRIYGFEYARNVTAGTDNLTGAPDQIKWTAPERLKAPKPDYDEKCDIYSFGAVMWSLATHKVPFDKLAPRKIRDEVLKVPEDIPKEFAVIIEGCIDRDRKNRWNIEKVIDELSKLIPENLEDSS